jgi:hypothetical protein
VNNDLNWVWMVSCEPTNQPAADLEVTRIYSTGNVQLGNIYRLTAHVTGKQYTSAR